MHWDWKQWPWTPPKVEITKRTHTFKSGASMRIELDNKCSVVVCDCGNEVLVSVPPIGFREVPCDA